jgi:hypothetical protein
MSTLPRRAAIHLRVSTGEQITANRRRELGAVTARAGWEIVAVCEDAGISGAKGRVKGPTFHYDPAATQDLSGEAVRADG